VVGDIARAIEILRRAVDFKLAARTVSTFRRFSINEIAS